MFSLKTSLSWKFLLENKLRFAFSIVGIGVSIALIFINQGFQDGLLRQVKSYLLNSGADIYVSQEGVDSFMLGSSAVSTEVKAQLLKVNGVEEVTDVVTTILMFDYKNEKTPAVVIGYDTNKEFGGPWKLKEGRYLKKEPLYKKVNVSRVTSLFSDKQVKPKEAILDFVLAKSYGLKVGDIVEIQDYEFEIIGLSEGTTSWIVSPIFMSRENARNVLKTDSNITSFFLVKVKDGFNASTIKQEIIRRSADSKRISERISGLEVLTATEIAANDEQFTREFFVSMLGIVTFLTYVIGILIIGLVIYILTLEKIRDYAILKAVGAENRQVLYTVLLQTLISATIGFVIGILIAFGFEYATTQVIATQYMIIIEREFIGSVVVGVFLMSLLASVVPIRKVFSVEPTLVFSSRQN